MTSSKASGFTFFAKDLDGNLMRVRPAAAGELMYTSFRPRVESSEFSSGRCSGFEEFTHGVCSFKVTDNASLRLFVDPLTRTLFDKSGYYYDPWNLWELVVCGLVWIDPVIPQATPVRLLHVMEDTFYDRFLASQRLCMVALRRSKVLAIVFKDGDNEFYMAGSDIYRKTGEYNRVALVDSILLHRTMKNRSTSFYSTHDPLVYTLTYEWLLNSLIADFPPFVIAVADHVARHGEQRTVDLKKGEVQRAGCSAEDTDRRDYSMMFLRGIVWVDPEARVLAPVCLWDALAATFPDELEKAAGIF